MGDLDQDDQEVVDEKLWNEDEEEWVADFGDTFLDKFSFWTDLNNEYGVVPTGITEVDYATAANYFAMGYTSMMLSGSNAIGVAYANNPELKGNIRDYATINELICLSNMENLNALFIEQGLPQGERLIKLNQIAIHQMGVLESGEIGERKLLK